MVAGNPLVEIVNVIMECLARATRVCLVCDKPHPLELLKPTVCAEQLCNFQLTLPVSFCMLVCNPKFTCFRIPLLKALQLGIGNKR